MKQAIVVIIFLAFSSGVLCMVGATRPECYFIWQADALVIGTVVAIDDRFIEVEVSEWIPRESGDQCRLKALRLERVNCYPLPPEPVSLGSRYLLFLANPGAWRVFEQVPLTSADICMDCSGSSIDHRQLTSSCHDTIPQDVFLDAIRSFNKCFIVTEDKIKGRRPVQTCSDRDLASWSERSTFHRHLATLAASMSPRRPAR